jgi:hypothetical protein
MGKPLIDLTGMRFVRLLVKEKCGYDGKSLWRCVCDCGNECVVRSPHLRSGKQVSCGCLRTEKAVARLTKHGQSRANKITRQYQCWSNMRERCNNPNNVRYERYGGRGISVCERWQNSFENFVADMGEMPAKLTLDRIDPNGNYEPANCRWASYKEQSRNKTNNVVVHLDGAQMLREDARAIMGISNWQMNRLIKSTGGNLSATNAILQSLTS